MSTIERTPEDKLPYECAEPSCDQPAVREVGYCDQHAREHGWRRGWMSEDGDWREDNEPLEGGDE